ncbi:MAG: HlyD family type I secretion periplasmic adaptor subunit [Cellvibrionaceae bacterium]|nr:HlyD family type I secretion periplasmic adaptor subunit [Cellvibrionaceae bacterium]
MNTLNTVKQAWAERATLGDQHHQRDMAAFLPAALSIQSTPPHPLARWLSWSLITLVLLGVLWAYLGTVNIVASAEGKIIPSSRVKQIQPLEKALVKTILVEEGQYVQQGDPLIELDNTLTASDQSRIQAELHTLQQQMATSEQLIRWFALPAEQQAQLTAVSTAHTTQQTLTPIYQQLLWQQWQHYWTQYQSLLHTQSKTQAEQAALHEQIHMLEQTLPIVQRRMDKVNALYQKKFASEDEYLTLKQEYIQQTQTLATEQQRLKQLQAAQDEIQQRLHSHGAQSHAQQLTAMVDYQRQYTVLQEELTKAKDRNAKQVLHAPVSGRVQSLATHTIGGVVTEAQQLMLIVPTEEQLEIDVMLDNKDIGFVQEGMPAEIKIHTFPFTKYGVVNGVITTVADDAILDEQRGLLYSMRIAMDRSTLWVEGKEVKLIPGMAVTAEIHTGKRRLIEFFLAPLMQYKQEGLRER